MEASIEDKFSIANLREISGLISQRFGEYKDLHELLNNYLSSNQKRINHFKHHDPYFLDLAVDEELTYLKSLLPSETIDGQWLSYDAVERMIRGIRYDKVAAFHPDNHHRKGSADFTGMPTLMNDIRYVDLRVNPNRKNGYSIPGIIAWFGYLTKGYYDERKKEGTTTYSGTLTGIAKDTLAYQQKLTETLPQSTLDKHLLFQNLMRNFRHLSTVDRDFNSEDNPTRYQHLASISGYFTELRTIRDVVSSLDSEADFTSLLQRSKLYASMISKTE